MPFGSVFFLFFALMFSQYYQGWKLRAHDTEFSFSFFPWAFQCVKIMVPCLSVGLWAIFIPNKFIAKYQKVI
ncbi:conserved hypothetical protein [delta proteobacterium NaphS2]|nr:conserved hypothetical protein [delta proteobacterium NaphS2]